MLGQFKETYGPPGYLLQWGSNGTGDGQFGYPEGIAEQCNVLSVI
jgi:hypothetical protein